MTTFTEAFEALHALLSCPALNMDDLEDDDRDAIDRARAVLSASGWTPDDDYPPEPRECGPEGIDLAAPETE